MKRTQIKLIVLLLIIVMIAGILLSGCQSEPPEETQPQKKEYIYPGEETTMIWKNPAYGKEEYAEGADLYVWVNNRKDDGLEYSYTGTVHWVENHENHIFSLLCLPEEYDGTQKYPLVLMVHGYNSNFHEYDYYVNFLTEAGYAVLLFDFRGGHMSSSLSDGKMKQMSYDTKVSDIRAMMSYAKTLSMVDQDNIIFIGHSQGGMMGMITACTDGLKDQFNGMILLAPVPFGDYLVEFDDPENLPDSYTILYATIGRDFLYSALKYEKTVWSQMKDYNYPVKILLGTGDTLIQENGVQEIVSAFGENASYEMVEGGFHDFQDDVLPNLMPETIIPFLNSLVS